LNRELILESDLFTFVADTTPPVVTLSWSSPINIELNGTFSDPGASWTDNVDGSGNTFTGTYGSTGSFAVSGSVDTFLC
jgi:hypothetical protein